MKTKTKRKIHRGICPVCGASHKLRADGMLCAHPLNRYLPQGERCKGGGMAPMNLAKEEKATGHTYVAILLDASGSMETYKQEAIEAFNAAVAPLREKDEDYHVSFYTFGEKHSPARNWAPELKFSDRAPSSIPVLTAETYKPFGGTALNDSILRAVKDFKHLGDETSSYLVLVVTDGQDQCSSSSYQYVRNVIRGVGAERYTFAASCPHQGASYFLSVGFLPGNINLWEQTKRGAEEMGQRSGQAVRTYTQARDAGETSVKNFYEVVNVGRKPVAEVTRGLCQTAPNDFTKFAAKKACTIQEAIEARGLIFGPGCGYYELSKPEEIQPHKKVLLELRQDGAKRTQIGALYEGDQVRSILGIPKGASGRIEPGNLGEWIVWVQSTSNNRKLLAKQRVLYRK